MTPIFFTSSSNNYSSYPSDHYEDQLHTHQFLSPISQPSSSSKSFTTHMFLNSNDQNEIFNRDLNESPQYQHDGDHFGSQAYKDHGIENDNMKGLEDTSSWNKSSDLHQVKWMSSKMRVMLKMKKSHHHPMKLKTYSSTSTQVTKLEDHNALTEETDNSSNNSTSSNNNNNIPIRVCSDCNTTKTPLWRSGPCGPKSLCNACGIRQRKARRAAAAAALAAAAAENGDFNDQRVMAPIKVTKTQHKDHKKPIKGHVTKFKKRQYSKQVTITTTTPPPSASPSPSSSPPSVRKNCVEEFLASLTKKLTFNYHVLPQDEREAAILLMALSCGYAHEP